MAKRILRTIRSETVELVRISVTKVDENPYQDRGTQERRVRQVRDGEHIERMKLIRRLKAKNDKLSK